MPTYRITDPNSGRTIRVTGDSPPTEEELGNIFGSTFHVSGPDAQTVKGLIKQGYGEREITDYLSNRNKVETPEIRAAKYGEITPTEPGFLATEAPALGGAITGSILGGKIGAIAPIPGGTAIGATLGAGIGAMTGEAGKQAYRGATGQETNLSEIPKQGLYQAGAEITGIGAIKGLKKVIPHVLPQYMRQEIRQLGEEFAPYVDKYLHKRSVTQGFLPAQIAAPQSAAGKYQKIIESTFTGAKPIREFEFAQERGVRDLARDTASDVWRGLQKIPREKLGEQVTDAIDLADRAHAGVASNLYQRVDNIASGITVPRTKTVTSRILDQNGNPITKQVTIQSNDIVDYTPLRTFLESVQKGRMTGRSEMGDAFINKVLRDIEDVGGTDTFAGAHDLRARIGAEITSLENRDPAHRVAILAKKQLTDIMDKTADTVQSPELKQAYHNANRFYKAYAERYKNDFIINLLKKASDVSEGGTPSAAVELIFKNERPELIDSARKAIGPSTEAWKNIKAGLLERWMKDSTDAEGNLLGTQFFNKIKSFGPEALIRTFGTDTAMQLKNLERIASVVQKPIPAGGGSMLAQLVQAGQIMSLVGVAGGGAVGAYTDDPALLVASGAGALGALASPRILAKMLVHPQYGKMFMDGFKPGIPTEQSIKSVARLMSAAFEYATQDARVSERRKALESLPGKELKNR